MRYFYDNDVRKIPGPSYVFDVIWTDPNNHPGLLSHDDIYSNVTLRGVEIGRYILYSPIPGANGELSATATAYAGTAWQKVYNNGKLQFSVVADKYTNPIQALTGKQVNDIWDEVWSQEE